MPHPLFTIGHSTHAADYFLDLLRINDVTAVADVRSRPYSRLNPQFNRETLKASLKVSGIAYAFLGAELGARTDDPSCYVDGKVQYDRLARTPLFRAGLTRVLDGARSHRIVLLCAEKDPITCHRMILVCHELRREPIEIFHIRADGTLEPNHEAELRMVKVVALPESDLFTSGEQAIEDAYRKQGGRIAWVEGAECTSGLPTVPADAEAQL